MKYNYLYVLVFIILIILCAFQSQARMFTFSNETLEERSVRIARSQHLQEEFLEAIEPKFYYWPILILFTLISVFIVFRIVHSKGIQLKLSSHAIPLVLFIGFIYFYSKILGSFLEIIIDDLSIFEYSSMWYLKLPFLIRSSIVGAIGLPIFWLVSHPLIVFSCFRKHNKVKIIHSYIPSIVLGIVLLFAVALWFFSLIF